MAATELARSLASLSEGISKDLDRLADRAFEVAKQAKSLQQHSHKRYADVGVQASVGSSSQPAYKLDRATRLDAFQFQPLNQKLNWKKLRSLNLDRMERETDTASLMDIYNNIAYADLSSEGVYELCESNLLKVIHTCQLLLQFQQHNVEQAYHAQQLADEQCNELAAALQRLPELSMTDVKEGLLQLEGDFYGVADADLDAMFTQARVEERTAASNMIESSVQQAKAALSAQNQEHRETQPPMHTSGAHSLPHQQHHQQNSQSISHGTSSPTVYSSISSSMNLPPPAFSGATSQVPTGPEQQKYPPMYQAATRDDSFRQQSQTQGSSRETRLDTINQQNPAAGAAAAAAAAAAGQHSPEAGSLRTQQPHATSLPQFTGLSTGSLGPSGNASLSRFRP